MLFLFFPFVAHAIPTIDIQKLNSTKSLDGPWVYAKGVLSHEEVIQSQQTIELPVHFQKLNDFSSQDVVSLALNLKTTPHEPFVLDLNKIYTVWSLFVNDTKVASSGSIDTNNKNHQAHAHNQFLITIHPTSATTKLLLHVANSQHRHLGFSSTPVVAAVGILEKQKQEAQTFQLIIAVILFAFGVYHLGLFLAWRRDKAPLWFGLLSLALGLRATATGEKNILQLFSDISWEMLLRVEYFSGYIALPLFVLYVSALYPKYKIRYLHQSYLAIGGLFIFLIFFASTNIFTQTLMYYQLVVVSFIFYTIWILVQSYKAKEVGSLIAMSAFILFSLTIVHDLLMFANFIVSSKDFIPYGFTLYLLAQALILILKYAQAFKIIEAHTTNLEELVDTRTKELSDLLSQKALILKELTHRVKNNLQFIISLLWIQRKHANDNTNKTLSVLEAQVQAISTVHETLCGQENISHVEIKGYMNSLIDSLKDIYNNLEITKEIEEDIFIKADDAVSLGLIFNELIANHIKHCKDLHKKDIYLSIQKIDGNKVQFVYNDGHNHSDSYHSAKTKKFGLPSLGWPMIKEFAKQMEADLKVHKTHLELEFDANKDA